MKDTLFIDYLMLHSIELSDDLVFMVGLYVNPATGVQEVEEFFVDFDTLYRLLDEEYCMSSAYVIEAIADALNSSSPQKVIVFDPDQIVVFIGLIFKLSRVEAMNDEKEFCFAGYQIDDAIEVVDGVMSLEQYVEGGGSKKEQVVYRAMSAHMVSLALRYEYYRVSIAKGKKKADMLRVTGMEVKEDFAVAKHAHGFVCAKGKWLLL